MTDPTPIALSAGDLAYLNSHEGLVPAKVTSVGDVNGWPKVTVKVTADRQAYKRGDIVTWPPTFVAPRASVRSRNSEKTILDNWHIVPDDGGRVDVFG